MGYKASGKIVKIFDTEQKSASFQAREFVIEVADGQYPQKVKFQLVQDKCTLVDEYAEGDVVTVEFDLRGREWNGKYFTNLQAWRMNRGEDSGEGDNAGAASSDANAGNAKSAAPAPVSQASADFDDDIPF